MKSTCAYWRLWYYLLESLGLAVALVNSSQARQLVRSPQRFTGSVGSVTPGRRLGQPGEGMWTSH
jgi:hypothetical protein